MAACEANVANRSEADSTQEMHVAACISHPGQDSPVAQHAFALAKSLGAQVTLLQVLEASDASDRPDPIEWDLRRHEARRSLSTLATPPDASMERAAVQLADGQIAEEIRRFANDHAGSLLVVGMQAPRESCCRGIGTTLHHLLHKTSGAILLVPPTGNTKPLPAYRRIMVPVDGSPWAASALPLAVRLAKAGKAELVLAHVIPPPELTETSPYNAADLDLRRQVVERNTRTAQTYLERMRQNVADLGIRVRVVSAQCKDVRVALKAMIAKEAIDLVILSARGHGLTANTEMPYGSVAGYLMMHSPAPLLVVPATIRQRHTPVDDVLDLRMPILASA